MKAPDPSREARCEFCHGTTAPLITGKDGWHAHRACAEQAIADFDRAIDALGAVVLDRPMVGIPPWRRL